MNTPPPDDEGASEMQVNVAEASAPDQLSYDNSNVVALRLGNPIKHREVGEWQTAIDLLNDAIADIRAGRVDPKIIFVGMFCRDEAEKTFTEYYPHYALGGSLIEIRGLLCEFMLHLGEKDKQ